MLAETVMAIDRWHVNIFDNMYTRDRRYICDVILTTYLARMLLTVKVLTVFLR